MTKRFVVWEASLPLVRLYLFHCSWKGMSFMLSDYHRRLLFGYLLLRLQSNQLPTEETVGVSYCWIGFGDFD